MTQPADFDTDQRFANRLGAPRLFAVGKTDAGTRRELLRAAIKRGQLGSKSAGFNRKLQKSETWAEVFERVYGEPL